MLPAFVETDARKHLPHLGARDPVPGERERQRDVLFCGERADQVEGLEHEADPVPG
ncbi:hypothetical protein ACFS2C_06820 [Prauserella oleivorans]|uniref:Uncharacterized protein n=1 Tax=Prauserella oleivorans TaxID=1478153 RepID=A0ABW5W6K1_9PSEU